MSMNTLKYKDYVGAVEFDGDAGIFHGEVINTRDVITFQGESVKKLEKAFKDSVEDYLEFCAERGEEPDRPFSGKFNMRLDPELHREAYLAARHEGKSLNGWITDVIIHAVHEQH